MFCVKCGSKLKRNASFCSKCGEPVNNQESVSESNSEISEENTPGTESGQTDSANISKKSRRPLIIAVSVVALIAVVATSVIIGFNLRSSQSDQSQVVSETGSNDQSQVVSETDSNDQSQAESETDSNDGDTPVVEYTLSEYLEEKGFSIWFISGGDDAEFVLDGLDQFSEAEDEKMIADELILPEKNFRGTMLFYNGNVIRIYPDFFKDQSSNERKYTYGGVGEITDSEYDEKCKLIRDMIDKDPDGFDPQELVDSKIVFSNNKGYVLFEVGRNNDLINPIFGAYNVQGTIEVEPQKIGNGYFCGFIFYSFDENQNAENGNHIEGNAQVYLTRVNDPDIRIHLDPPNPDKDVIDPILDDSEPTRFQFAHLIADKMAKS
ncbi:MAG: zinc-ribbon domain-containing protein [Eubacterium sp.]|nr:zinc-ribbon domain-containing protein [Eubacterium sp.]